ncbi:hypothetical protein BU23DRAFT_648624, partial [Bimuria novae-zelandiae CBS 107.79]
HRNPVSRFTRTGSNTNSGRCASKGPAHFLLIANQSNCLFSVPQSALPHLRNLRLSSTCCSRCDGVKPQSLATVLYNVPGKRAAHPTNLSHLYSDLSQQHNMIIAHNCYTRLNSIYTILLACSRVMASLLAAAAAC